MDCGFQRIVRSLGAAQFRGNDLLAATQTLLFGALGVFYVALGVARVLE